MGGEEGGGRNGGVESSGERPVTSVDRLSVRTPPPPHVPQIAGEGVVSATHYLEKARLASALPAHKVADGRDKQPAGQRAGAPPTPPPSAPTSSPPAAGGPSAPRAANGTEASGVAAATSDGAGVGAKSGRFAVRRSSLLCQDDRR